jgi:hypothetical protein
MRVELWRGIYKLQEEMGDLQQLLGKLGAFPSEHPSGEDTVTKVWEEVADVQAALVYFRRHNAPPTQETYIVKRMTHKLELFETWNLSGVKPNE